MKVEILALLLMALSPLVSHAANERMLPNEDGIGGGGRPLARCNGGRCGSYAGTSCPDQPGFA